MIKADFMHTKGTTFPSKMKIGIHIEEYCSEIGTHYQIVHKSETPVCLKMLT